MRLLSTKRSRTLKMLHLVPSMRFDPRCCMLWCCLVNVGVLTGRVGAGLSLLRVVR